MLESNLLSLAASVAGTADPKLLVAVAADIALSTSIDVAVGESVRPNSPSVVAAAAAAAAERTDRRGG